jgi:cellulose synthase (UDP-forming)
MSNHRSSTPLRIPGEVGEEDKYAYLGRQQRWYVVANWVAFVVLMISMSRFSLAVPAASPLLLVSLLLFVGGTLGLYTTTRPRRVQRAEHDALVAAWSPARYPSVDVFLPTCGEALEILRNTYLHVTALDYAGEVAVHVLDDGGRDEVRCLAEEYGFRYLSRPAGQRGELKKAGNLNFAFPLTGNEVILILDADFAPRSDLLNELMPYLDDPTVGIAQSPQYFDTKGPMGWLQRGAGATQEFFYRWVQPSRDALDAPICVGTCALYRRAALEKSGWFVPIAHSEDVYTGLQVMKAGYSVRYVPVILARGLCPDTLAAFISQQYRWCTGSLSLLVNPDFHRMPLNLRQRMCFWSGFLYYISTAINVFTSLLPPLFLLWLDPSGIALHNYFWLLPVLFMYPVTLAIHNANWRIGVLRAKMAYSFTHAIALWHTYQGQLADWVVTGADQPATSLPLKVSRIIRGWLTFIQAGLWGGIAFDVVEHRVRPLLLIPLIVMGVFNGFIEVPLFVRAAGLAASARHRAGHRKVAPATAPQVGIAGVAAQVALTPTVLDLSDQRRVTVHLPEPLRSRGRARSSGSVARTTDSEGVSVGVADSWRPQQASLAEPPHGQ